MCFSDFPTETYREALQTVGFVKDLEDDLALFILGRFDLTHGSLVAQKPGEFGIKEAWHVEGDLLKTGLFFQEKRRAKSASDQVKLEEEVSALSDAWHLRRYPWAGALSTAHTMLWYARFGKEVFRRAPPSGHTNAEARTAEARFDVARIAHESAAREAEIWEHLVYELRRVTRPDYEALAARAPLARPSKSTWRYAPGGGLKKASAGRRPSHAANATKGA
jgi:hypothetical protein